MSKAEVAAPAGDVTIQLGGEPATLRCTLRSWRDVSARFGSFAEAYRRVAEFDGPAIVAVIAAATGRTVPDVEEGVFFTGIPDIIEAIKDYLGKLSNGGRVPMPPVDKDAPKGEE
jgi:hypothetical protein